MLPSLLIAIAVGYVLGALPFGYIVARAHGVDIFEVGSRNPGATNVKRVLGARAGNLVFALDVLKGAVAAGWPLLWCVLGSSASSTQVYAMAISGLVGALLGHSFSCFTRFKGGKGVATAAGGFLVLMPVPALLSFGVWVAVFYSFRYVSLASILASIALPVAAFAFGNPPLLTITAVFAAVLVIVRHSANIARLCNGTENRFARKSEIQK